MGALRQLAADWPQIDRLLDEALALPEGERDAWLQAMPAATAPLRDTLRRLLAAHAEAQTGGFLDALGPLPQAAARLAGASPQAGDVVGPYRLIRELGAGGMGQVWLAERADGQWQRQVALKLPRVAWDDALAGRMARERDILATLEHPHIARLYDAGADAQGRPYLALEYVAGDPVDACANARGLGTRERVGLILQVCSAVAYAHSRLVIHRDLKPSNILVGADGSVRLLDFGIARLLEDERSEPSALTRLGGRAMSLDYASPEQVRGEPLGTPSDVYSLGVVAFELLCGVRPYRLRRGSAAELEEAIAMAEPARPSSVAATPAARRALRGDLDAILMKALEKQPGQRYAGVAALAEDLARHLRGEPVQARPVSPLVRLWRFCWRHRIGVGAVAAVVAALALGFAQARWQAREARAALERETAVRTMYAELMAGIAAWDPARWAAPRAVANELKARLADFDARYRDLPEQRLGLWDQAVGQLAELEDHEGVIELGRRNQALLAQAGAASDRQVRAGLQVALAQLALGRMADAQAGLERLLQAHAPTRDNRNERATALIELAKIAGRQGDLAGAQKLLADPSVHEDDLDADRRWELQMARARLQVDHDDDAAWRLARIARDTYAREPTAYPGRLASSELWVSLAALAVARPDDAERAARAAGAVFEAQSGRTSRDSILALGARAGALNAQGRHAEARQLLLARRADVDARPDDLAAEHRAMLDARLLETELASGSAAAAARLAMRPPTDLPLLQRNPELPVYLRGQARALTLAGRSDHALAQARQWLQALAAQRRPTPALATARLALAEAEAAAGDAQAARSTLEALLADLKARDATRNAVFREATRAAAAAAQR